MRMEVSSCDFFGPPCIVNRGFETTDTTKIPTASYESNPT